MVHPPVTINGLLVENSEIIFRAGRTLYVPKIKKGSARTMDFLRIHDAEDLESLPSGVWGIKEPGVEHAGSVRKNGAYRDFRVVTVAPLHR